MTNRPAAPAPRSAFMMLGLMALAFAPAHAGSTPVAIQHEPPEGVLRLGQRVRVDDGSCPAGQVKEVTAAQLGPKGILRTRVCVKR